MNHQTMTEIQAALRSIPLPERWSVTSHRKHELNSHGYRGVHFCAEHAKWRAEIIYLGKRIRLGRFKSPHQAAAAYNSAARKYYGEFAVLNDLGREAVAKDFQVPEPRKRTKRRARRFYERKRRMREAETSRSAGAHTTTDDADC